MSPGYAPSMLTGPVRGCSFARSRVRMPCGVRDLAAVPMSRASRHKNCTASPCCTVRAAGMSWLKRLCITFENPSSVLAPAAPGEVCAITRSGLPTPAAGTPSAAAAKLEPTPATAAAAALPREICSINVRLEILEWTKHTAHPPRLTARLVGVWSRLLPAHALCTSTSAAQDARASIRTVAIRLACESLLTWVRIESQSHDDDSAYRLYPGSYYWRQPTCSPTLVHSG